MAKALQQHVQALAHLAKVTPGDWLIGWSGFGTQNPDDPKQDAASGDSNRWLICKFAKRLGSPIFNSHHLPFSAFDAHARTKIACSAHALYTQATCKRPAGKSKRGAWNEDSCLAAGSVWFPKRLCSAGSGQTPGSHLEKARGTVSCDSFADSVQS